MLGVIFGGIGFAVGLLRAIKGSKEGIPFTRANGRVVKDMTASPPRKIQKLSVEIDMPAGLTPGQRAKLEGIAKNCPVALSLSSDVEQPIQFNYPD